MKVPFIIHSDLEPFLVKMSTCLNNRKKLSTTKINKHEVSGYSLFTNCSFDKTKIKLSYYRGKNCMKNFFKDLREHATKINDCNWTRTHNHLVRKRTLNHLAKLTK